MLFHHGLSSICFFGALYTQKMLFAVYALGCEHTTVPPGCVASSCRSRRTVSCSRCSTR